MEFNTQLKLGKDVKFSQRRPCIEVKSLSRVRLLVTPCTVAYQAPPSMECSRLEYWSGLPFPSPGDLPNPLFKVVTVCRH